MSRTCQKRVKSSRWRSRLSWSRAWRTREFLFQLSLTQTPPSTQRQMTAAWRCSMSEFLRGFERVQCIWSLSSSWMSLFSGNSRYRRRDHGFLFLLILFTSSPSTWTLTPHLLFPELFFSYFLKCPKRHGTYHLTRACIRTTSRAGLRQGLTTSSGGLHATDEWFVHVWPRWICFGSTCCGSVCSTVHWNIPATAISIAVVC